MHESTMNLRQGMVKHQVPVQLEESALASHPNSDQHLETISKLRSYLKIGKFSECCSFIQAYIVKQDTDSAGLITS